MSKSNLKVYALRLRPNQDLNQELDNFVKQNGLKSAFIMTCVGSLTKATVRMAFGGQEENEVKVYQEHMEIVSLVGTLSCIGGHHLHISLSTKNGQVLGGHVFGEMNVFTTAEIVIGECEDLAFKREFDPASGFDELVVCPRN
ncbi:bifunctional -like [Brachionus plicatilis]|uniref:Bifunctional-like n=1 Tax=Brachionus plicatilis TaxID=10195 RepID=A0A3M7PGJ0_BRAPC|nr:bifunctional -like [Brachionus plicatilis]